MNKILVLLISLFLALPFSLLGQIKIHKHLTTSDGLVNDIITVIAQDKKGYIWFGTENGVSRWDGKNFLNLQKHNGLTTSNVSDIIITNDSTIYIATFGGGIVTYKDSKLDTLDENDGLLTNRITKIYETNTNEILFGGINGNISILKEGKLTKWIDPKYFNYKDVSAIFQSSDSTIYIGFFQGGFYAKKGNKLTHYTAKDGMHNEDINCFEEDPDGTIYFGTNFGIHQLKNGKIKYLNSKWGFRNTSVKNIKFLNEKIYFASDLGLVSRINNKTEIVGVKNGLSFNEVSGFWIDQYRIVYLGTHGNGVDIYRPERIENYNKKTGLPDDKVWSITEDKQGKLFLGTQKGLAINNGKKQKVITLSNIYYANVAKSVIHTKNNITYVGTTYGLNILTNSANKKLTKKDGLIDTYIMDMAKTHSGEILLGTRFGVVKIADNKITNITTKDGLIDNYVQTVLVAKDGSIYYGTNGKGISIYKNGSYKYLTTKNGLSDNNIQTLVQSNDGTIYIGTYEGGLNILKDGKVSVLDINDGLSSNSIKSIAISDSDEIYLGTFKGLNIVNLSNKIPKIKIIDQENGLASDRCLKEAIFIDKNKYLWIGTAKGLTKYNLKSVRKNTYPPKIYLTGFEIFNKKYDIKAFQENPILNYTQNYLKFTFTGINLSAPNKLLYKYKLKDVDSTWIKSKENYVQYTNLNDGNYKFEVSAMNEEGVWSKPVFLAFVIAPAWYNTWWFYSFLIFAIGSLIAFVASYRYRNLLAVEKIRTKISADLHDSIGSGLSEITILSELLNSQPNAKISDLQKGLKNISVTARSLVGNMSDIVWLVNPSKDSLKDLLLRLQDSYHEVLAQSNISFKINNIENLNDIHLPMTFRQHSFLIFKEAINNALKYSNCTKMLMDISLVGKSLTIIFNDNGIGFDVNIKRNGNGLRNMIERAKMIEGKLGIISNVNKGTTIKFSGKI